MLKNPIIIAAAMRTPIGNFQGSLKSLTTPELGAAAIRAAVAGAAVQPTDVDKVLMGCVLPAGLGQAPARQASLGAGLPVSAGCVTVNKMCGSGMETVILAHDMLVAQSCDVVVAGGMESMSNAPYLLPKARAGYRMGHQVALDHMLYDGLEDAYQKGSAMGVFAEDCARSYGFTREAQDAFAISSITRARQAAENGAFQAELTPITVTGKEGNSVIDRDEGPFSAKIDKIPQLKPAFRVGGTITAANASSLSDGAAALVLMRQETAQQRDVKPLATLVAHSTHAQQPELFTTAPIGAIQKLLAITGWTVADVDLFEINEAFAVVTMAAMQDLHIPHDKVNVHGGGCILGHPIGASGARIIVTLAHALVRHGKRRGIAALCIGGGEATAVALERV